MVGFWKEDERIKFIADAIYKEGQRTGLIENTLEGDDISAYQIAQAAIKAMEKWEDKEGGNE